MCKAERPCLSRRSSRSHATMVFPLVILIAGNKDNLLTQSHERLARDLNTEGGDGLPVWRMRKNIRANEAHDEQFIRQSIDSWRDITLDDDERATVLLTVLKQNQRLDNLTTLLSKLDMRDVPVLIIDDEADQASLNTKVQQGDESTNLHEAKAIEGGPSPSYLPPIHGNPASAPSNQHRRHSFPRFRPRAAARSRVCRRERVLCPKQQIREGYSGCRYSARWWLTQ